MNADAILIGMAFRGLNLFICNNNPVNCDDSTGNYPGYHYQTRYNAERAAALYKIKNPEYQYHTIDIQYVSGLPESHPFSATWIYQLISPAPVFQSVKDDLIGPPNSSKQYYDKNGNLKIETWFGPDGRATTSEHHTNHGNSKSILRYRIDMTGIGVILNIPKKVTGMIVSFLLPELELW